MEKRGGGGGGGGDNEAKQIQKIHNISYVMTKFLH